LGRRVLIEQIMVEALETVLWRQIEQSVLERIFDDAPLDVDLVVAPARRDVVTKLGEHPIENLGIAREQDVRPTDIERVAVLDEALAMTARPAVRLQHLAIVTRVTGDHHARQSTSKNSDAHIRLLP